MNKAVYVSILPLTPRVRRDWSLDALSARGANVEYLDISALWDLAPSSPRPAPLPWERRLSSPKELDAAVAAPENADAWFVLLVIPGDPRGLRLMRRLADAKRRTCYFHWGLLPSRPPSLARKLARKIKSQIFSLAGLINPYDVVFAAGRAALRAHPPSRRVIAISHCDFESFRALDSFAPPPVSGRYAIFLDNNQPFNVDLDFLGLPRLDAARYFRSLNRFFGLLETRFGLRVAVAAHPKSDYAPDLFEGRPIIKGETPRLVLGAERVLCHHSTSFGCAVMARKPLSFLYTDDMERLYAKSHLAPMRDYAGFLDAPLINVDRVSSPGQIESRPADEERCARYVREFLTTEESESRSNADAVFSALFGG